MYLLSASSQSRLSKIEALERFSAVSNFRHLDENFSAEAVLDVDLDIHLKKVKYLNSFDIILPGILGTTMPGTD